PKDRVLMMGFAGLLLTSASGAKLTWIPTARPSVAAAAAIVYASPGSPVAPAAMTIGNAVAPTSRIPAPHSRSAETSSGTRGRRAARRPASRPLGPRHIRARPRGPGAYAPASSLAVGVARLCRARRGTGAPGNRGLAVRLGAPARRPAAGPAHEPDRSRPSGPPRRRPPVSRRLSGDDAAQPRARIPWHGGPPGASGRRGHGHQASNL